ncbi:hypothetical protein HWQ46_08630 [Shewanella sp. D64]|uniref:hypothetical protein n=1 Tax=unclassified Shewanella TaxID=196818 RepID=UPI0022BA5C71|nr:MULTISPECIES: hypothetical protein [unclassified Shewanella]MEC4725603.1 hypothetical protein [Shewanella sp. D64]MEC4739655.1 hypothetical protein [Shewanella sp. E94]WBJ94880.1 hypothetical protein HWQ47_24065 [Shewanella sp. MTB7]
MVAVKRIQSGQYSVSDGRYIIKEGSSWYVLNSEQKHDFGPLPTLAAAKQYVTNGTTPIGEHNLASNHGRRQSKKEFNAYLASEAENGNLGPAIIYAYSCDMCTFLRRSGLLNAKYFGEYHINKCNKI